MQQVQYRGIRSNDIAAAFRDMNKQVIGAPPRYRTGDVIYPYADARK